MKQLYALIISLLTVVPALAQTHGNEWIDYSQKYIKIKIWSDGIYRLDSTTLANAIAPTGTSLASIDPRNFQLFHNGQEEYIWIEGESDFTFNGGDYIEFIGRKNIGEMDAELYGTADSVLNPYFSLYSDTSAYFLTWNSSTTNRRFNNPQDINFGSYSLSNWFTNEERFVGNTTFFPGVQDNQGITDPEYLNSEGFYFYDAGYGSPQTFNLNSQFADPAGPPAIIRMRIGTHSNDYNTPSDNDVRIQYLSTTFDSIYDGYGVGTYTDTVPSASLNPATTAFTIQNVNLFGSVSSGRISVAWINMKYPHTFDMENRTLFNGFLPDHTSQSKSHLQLTNVAGSGTVRYYDLYNHDRIDGVFNGSSWEFLVNNGNGTEKPFVVAAESAAQPVTAIAAVNGNGTFTDFALMSGDSAFVIVSCPKLWSVATDYAAYRSSPAGGSRDVVLANIWELYDQFAWGITYNPLAIRHLCSYLIDTFPTAPKHLLLLGKSIEGSNCRYGYSALNLVPTFGYPPSDNLITAQLNTTGWGPSIATGRIAAKDSIEARWYLDKVIEYENNPPAEWMKHVLHFGGGTSAAEQSSFASYLNGYTITIEDTSFGGTVDSYFKTSATPIQINQSDTLRERIEEGVSIMTFFGHASGTGFDQSIDDPANYNNYDRYPLLIANSCYAGDIHTTGISSSEAFTLLDGKGTIGYIASVSVGLAPYLNVYSSALYEAIADTLYGKSIGECMQYAIIRSQQSATFLPMKTTALEMTLQGDPAVVINSFDRPDYVITTPDIFFDATTYPDSIIVSAVMTNVGKAISDTMIVQIVRTFPNNDTTVYYLQVPTPKFKDTLELIIPTEVQRAVGINKFKVSLDWFGQIIELDELNNSNSPDAELLIH
ncbi:MAG TPA: C25 family cysteine peptidase, partial [Bacteroidia bacterium]|nr:C25 family cysteine peptidase [Bacteroidia bacterium]